MQSPEWEGLQRYLTVFFIGFGAGAVVSSLIFYYLEKKFGTVEKAGEFIAGFVKELTK